MNDVQASGHIRRRGDNGVAIAFMVWISLKDFIFRPKRLPLSFSGFGFVLTGELGER